MKLILLPSLQYHLWKMVDEKYGVRKPLRVLLGGENAVKSALSYPTAPRATNWILYR